MTFQPKKAQPKQSVSNKIYNKAPVYDYEESNSECAS